MPSTAYLDELKLAILQQIQAIPNGQVSSYGAIAKAVGYPSHARYVGSILKRLPKDSQIPWHRVVNGQGKFSFPLESDQYQEQYKRLQEEGVSILNGRVSPKQLSAPGH